MVAPWSGLPREGKALVKRYHLHREAGTPDLTGPRRRSMIARRGPIPGRHRRRVEERNRTIMLPSRRCTRGALLALAALILFGPAAAGPLAAAGPPRPNIVFI